MSEHNPSDLSSIPSMTALLSAVQSDAQLSSLPRAVISNALRAVVDNLRDQLRKNEPLASGALTVAAILALAAAQIAAQRARRLTRVINATGVILHTGLGRSVLSEAAVQRLTQVASGYCSLEIDLATGERGQRGRYAEALLCQLTGAESAMIVNNNAAATMLALRGLAAGKEVIVSRGQLIEIGGSYRLPDVMSAGGSILKEVGTTNKTHLSDYEEAISDRTAMIMHVHTSNYRVVGFAESPGIAELTQLAHNNNLIMFDDLGSGALLDDEMWAREHEPTVAASLKAGADFVSFSGDKLLGGPQAGILLGNKATIDRLRRDPMARALRVDKLTLAALEATLEIYLSPDRPKAEIPTLAALSESLESVTLRAERLAKVLSDAAPSESFTVERLESFAGGGSLPARPIPTAVVRWQPSSAHRAETIVSRMRTGNPAVLARIKDAAVLFDARSLAGHELELLRDAFCAALAC
ncbi:MAG: L-seryl-tRNA(Sec) selenium transferase [Planctomycetia bacterium]